MIQAASNDKAEELFRLPDEDFLGYMIENGIDCDYVAKNFKAWTIVSFVILGGIKLLTIILGWLF